MLIIKFFSFSEKSPSGPIRIQIGPKSFFDRMLLKLLLSQLMSQKTKHPFSGKLDIKFFNVSNLAISGIEIRFDCSADSIIIFLIRSVLISLTIVLSDKKINENQLIIPAPMAVGAVHHKLIENGLRCDTNIIVETGSARNPHHYAVLIGYGATAIYPYLAFEVLNEMVTKDKINVKNYGTCLANYIAGINKGLLKIMSKMGISCISSYRGALLFEIVGLDSTIIDLCFKDTVSRISGSDFSDIEEDLEENRIYAWDINKEIKTGGLLKYVHNEEYHDYNPDVVKALQECVMTGDYNDYKKYSDLELL